MKLKFTLSRPVTLIEGSEYLMKESPDTNQVTTLVPVTFVAFDPNSAFVIVSNGECRKRCSRDNLFIRVNSGIE